MHAYVHALHGNRLELSLLLSPSRDVPGYGLCALELALLFPPELHAARSIIPHREPRELDPSTRLNIRV